MSRERYDSVTARIPARITSALEIGRQLSERRRLAHEAGRVDMERIPQDQEIVLFQPKECLDTRVFNQSVTRQWVDDANPREDAWTPIPSRIGPSA